MGRSHEEQGPEAQVKVQLAKMVRQPASKSETGNRSLASLSPALQKITEQIKNCPIIAQRGDVTVRRCATEERPNDLPLPVVEGSTV